MIQEYAAKLNKAISETVGTDTTPDSRYCTVHSALRQVIVRLQWGGIKAIIIGNGGSAGIASHIAIDLTKNAGVPAMALNDPAALTCLSNDYGYEEVFAKQIDYHGKPNDVLLAISSSGQSVNIRRAVAVAASRRLFTVTFSGFREDNPLRRLGELNFYVPSSEYGFVELAHHTFLHCIVDELCKDKAQAVAA